MIFFKMMKPVQQSAEDLCLVLNTIWNALEIKHGHVFVCSKQWFKKIIRNALEKHDRDVDLFRNLSLDSAEKIRTYWAWALSIYLICTNEKGHAATIRIPEFPRKIFCMQFWLDLMDLIRKKFYEINCSITLSRNVVINVHANILQQTAFCSEVGQAVQNFITRHVERRAHSLTMHLSTTDGVAMSDDESVISVIYFHHRLVFVVYGLCFYKKKLIKTWRSVWLDLGTFLNQFTTYKNFKSRTWYLWYMNGV